MEPYFWFILLSCVAAGKPCTKRNVLSQLARIFDPLGFLTSLILKLKALSQQLWISGLRWYDTLILTKSTQDYSTTSSDRKLLTAWIDSTTELAWIDSSPHKWCTFVSNEVSQIHDIPPSQWSPIGSPYNAAGISSRGFLLQYLILSNYCRGNLTWLKLPETSWPLDIGVELF